jgi:hypothetical protein
MSLLNRQSDVKKHLSAHVRTHLHVASPPTESDRTGFSENAVPVVDPSASEPVLNSAADVAPFVLPAVAIVPAASPAVQAPTE